MADKPVPVDEKDLQDQLKANPKSKGWNNPNSRKNLRQHRKKEDEFIIPEVVADDGDDGTLQAQEIVRGRKLSPEMVKKLIPERGVFTAEEKRRFTGIVVQYLSDFKNEEPTASDADDIFEIAKSDILEMRILKATKNDTAAMIHSNQAFEKIYKRKQSAKENLAARRTDRKDDRNAREITIVDLVVNYDNEQKQLEKQRVERLLEENKKTDEKLKKVIREDNF
ncbi:hypothetical protein LCGC14_1265150 [marine sediment metagenome]|uniref:Uncharacterized protein n=1 Tax=marine sediment metagenome TaxID=412755 RepID=A0A0F9LKT9_9ZZZZ